MPRARAEAREEREEDERRRDGPGRFRRVREGFYVHSHGNLVKREQGRSVRLSVWKAVVRGKTLEPKHRTRAEAEQAVLEALRCR